MDLIDKLKCNDEIFYLNIELIKFLETKYPEPSPENVKTMIEATTLLLEWMKGANKYALERIQKEN